jgi:hypothetical protein
VKLAMGFPQDLCNNLYIPGSILNLKTELKLYLSTISIIIAKLLYCFKEASVKRPGDGKWG